MIDEILFEAEEKMDKAIAVAREDFEYLRGLAWQYTQAVKMARE